MTRLEAFRPAGGDWTSFRDGLAVGAPAPPVEGGARFFYTDAQVETFRGRMSGSGPFYNTGDAGHGGQYSPGDGSRALARANEFASNPSGSYWQQTFNNGSFLAQNDPWPGEDNITINQAIAPTRAAWCYMTLPNHPNNATWRAEVKALLLWTAQRNNHDYANSSMYRTNYPDFTPSPLFGTAGWITRLLKAYDMLGRDNFSSAELAVMDRWFYTFANYLFHYLHLTAVGGRVPGRLNYNFSTTTFGYTSIRPYDNGPFISDAGAWNNRQASCAESAALIANYLSFHGVTPSTAGTQPSYGWYTVGTMLHHAEVWYREFLHFSLSPLGYSYDFHRNNNASESQGWRYASQELQHMVSIAVAFARRGDLSILNHSTTAGYNNTAGSPNNTSGVSGFPAKNLHYFAWSFVRYVNDAWGRRVRSRLIAPCPPHSMDVNPVAQLNQYVTDVTLRAAWKRSAGSPAFPGYPQSPQTFGRFNGWDGVSGLHAGLVETGGS